MLNLDIHSALRLSRRIWGSRNKVAIERTVAQAEESIRKSPGPSLRPARRRGDREQKSCGVEFKSACAE